MGRAGLPERDLSQRKELFDAVKEMRTKGLSYNGIIAEVEKTRGVRLSRSHVSDWLTGTHVPDGSVRKFEPVPSFELGYVVGVALGDGTTSVSSDHNYAIKLQVNDREFAEEFARCLGVVLRRPPPNVRWWEARHAWRTQVSSLLLLDFLRKPIDQISPTIELTDACKIGFLRGFFDSEGSASKSLTVSNGDLSKLQLVIELLTAFGIETTGPNIGHLAGGTRMIKGKLCSVNKANYYLRVRSGSILQFQNVVGFSIERKSESLANHPAVKNKSSKRAISNH